MLVVPDYADIQEEYSLNYNNDNWYETISAKKAIQALALGIRQDRFATDFLQAL